MAVSPLSAVLFAGALKDKVWSIFDRGRNRVALLEGVSEADAPAARVLCLGVNGISVLLDAPNVAGEVNIYTDTQLKAYRIGKRNHDIMSEIASELTDEEIRELANWFANVELAFEASE